MTQPLRCNEAHLDQGPLAAAATQRHGLLETSHLDLLEVLGTWTSGRLKGHMSTHKNCSMVCKTIRKQSMSMYNQLVTCLYCNSQVESITHKFGASPSRNI